MGNGPRAGVGRDMERPGNGPTPKPHPSQRVLIVEDNLENLHSLTRLLKSDGHQVEFAINGYVALVVAKKFAPDVVLLDLGLPGMNGFDVCSRLKAEPTLAHIRVIAVTAHGDEAARARSKAVGCESHIIKPYDPAFLLALVNARRKKPTS